MFVSTMRKGFQMTFENGLTISVQWGAGNYCQNQHNFDHDNPFGHDMKSKNAEIAIFDERDEFIDPRLFIDCSTDGQVAGWLSAEEVAELIYKVSTAEKTYYLV